MNLRSSFAWWSSLKWRTPRLAGAADFADMGTAFGLDASMDPDPPAPARIPRADSPRRGFGAIGPGPRSHTLRQRR